MFNEMIVSLETCEPQLEELGAMILGPWGRIWGRLIQQGNFVLYMPVALLICAQAFQGYLEPSGETCVDYVILGVSTVCLLLTQFRGLGGRAAAILSWISLACVAVVVALLVVVVDETDADGRSSRKFGNSEMFSSRFVKRQRGFAKICLGASTTAWAFVPTFLSVELSRALEKPREDFAKALWLSAGLNIGVYVGVGVYVVRKWGWDVTDPLMTTEDLWPARSNKSRALYFFWFVATAISYAFTSLALTAACQKRWRPDFDVADWSLRGCATWFFLGLPGFLVALVLALVVPSLFAMLAVTTALTVPWVNHVYPAILYYKFSKQRRAPKQDDAFSYRDLSVSSVALDDRRPDDDYKNKRNPIIAAVRPNVLAAVVFTVGVIVFGACAYGASLKLADHQLRGAVEIGCPAWYLFEDDKAD
ncbi:hypothetical protein CTAYLR_008166 [Chrysophaeum taylorii]|uniref:Amino acid transporter transmembrane domain-containing protein n=1 Tax=Chrysophaeum taylorii TaxID=2483200 RepID=A0AAD7U925_9STRA|nr:hypothetical protein CTAYLR_008166 [Chrysophaeum taylorii]